MKFEKIIIPPGWKDSFTKYPNGRTIFKALSNTITTVNEGIEEVNHKVNQGLLSIDQAETIIRNEITESFNTLKLQLKSEIDELSNDIIADFALLQSQVLTLIAGKANAADVYTKSQVDAQLNDIEQDITDLQNRSIKQYGARRTLNATSPLLERIFDAAGKVANVPTDDGAAVNDFDNIFPWSHIRECKRDATGRIHYKGDPGYDLLTNVDWLIEIPKFYIRMQRTATTFDRVISEIKRAGFWVPSVFKRADGTECDKIYVGRFKTGKDGTRRFKAWNLP